MESTTDRLELRKEIEIAASPETVWELLVDPAKAPLWWGKAVMLEPRAGGALRIEVTPRSIAGGEVLVADRPRRLVFTWGWAVGGAGPELVPPGSTTVEIELVPTETGTTLTLVHRDLPAQPQVESHSAGWEHYLGRLGIAAGGGDPGPDPWQSGA